MKANTVSRYNYYACRRPTYSRVPNAAGRRYFWERLLDTVLAAAITLAGVVILLFLLILL